MTTFIDTNVIIYLTKTSSDHHKWAKKEFDKRKEIGPVIISDIVYAEFSAAMNQKSDTDEVVKTLGIERLRISDQALFHAGQLFKKYKSNSGPKNNVLSDFLIGAQATDIGAPLLTGNVQDFHRLFPNLELISP